MITKTIGSGGDYSDIGAAWAYLRTIDPLGDDYTFTIISDFTEVNGIPYYLPLDFSGYTVSFVNPTRYVITNNGHGYLFYSLSNVDDHLETEGLIIKQTTTVLSDYLMLTSAASTLNTMHVTHKNLTLIGNNTTLGANVGLYLRIGDDIKIHNLKVYGFTTGIEESRWSGTPAQNGYIENAAVYGCGYGINLNVGSFSTDADRMIYHKNIVIAGSITQDWWKSGGGGSIAYHQIINCADSDGSIATSGAVLSGNITGIVAGDFLSVDPTSADFLEIDQSSALYEKGTSTISTWNTEDYDANPRPHGIHLLTSIGAYEGIYSVPSGDYYTTDHSVGILNGLVQSWTKTATGRIPIIDIINAHTANRSNPHQVTIAQLYAGTLSEYADNAAAVAAGLAVGRIYRNGDFVCVAH